MADFWKDAGQTLGSVAPILASAIGGPLAGAATNAIINALGLAPDTPSDQVAIAVSGASADQLLLLKQAEQEFAVKMEQLKVDLTKLSFEDTASARNREAITKDKTPARMGYIVLFMALASGIAVFTGHISDSSVQGGVVLGYIFSEAKQVLSYYFGTSADGVAKTKMIYNSSPHSS